MEMCVCVLGGGGGDAVLLSVFEQDLNQVTSLQAMCQKVHFSQLEKYKFINLHGSFAVKAYNLLSKC